jgi:cell wall-associated NlpC family hydrolase
VAFAAPTAPVTVASVTHRLHTLEVANSQLVQRYDAAVVAYGLAQQSMQAAQAAAAQAQAQFDQASTAMTYAAASRYESGAMSTTGALLDSTSGQSYLQQLATLDMIANHLKQVAQAFANERAQAQAAATTAKAAETVAARQRDAISAQRTVIEDQMLQYRVLLNSLTAPQRAAYQATITPSFSIKALSLAEAGLSKGGSALAAKAVRFALAQVGKPYSWGAAGPGTYDCSGLTMASWAQAGVALPHDAAAQYGFGRHIPADPKYLKPGDLIFFYDPIGHVTIYIGQGLMVSAPTEGENVSVVPLSSFNGEITGATRLVS